MFKVTTISHMPLVTTAVGTRVIVINLFQVDLKMLPLAETWHHWCIMNW